MSPSLTIDWFNTAKFEPEYACVDPGFDDAPPPIVRNGVVEMHPDAWGMHDNDETLWHYRVGGGASEERGPAWLDQWPETTPAPGAAVQRRIEGRTFYYMRNADKCMLDKEQLSTLREVACVSDVVCFESLI